MPPKERAELLNSKYLSYKCYEVINHMQNYYIGINNDELLLYWEQVEEEFKNLYK
jgi:hypothetical protein